MPASNASLSAVATYSPITAASMISPPNRLYSRNFTAALRPVLRAEAADQEVHRDEHGLEEHVEQQHVEGDQRDQHHALDGQRQRQVACALTGPWSPPSFQPATSSSGTSTAVSTTSARAMPSRPRM